MNNAWIVSLGALLVSGCLLESVGRIHPNLKPYGAHWVKHGMTREGRLEDSVACGSARTVYVNFAAVKVQAARIPTDSDEFNAIDRLTEAWVVCMRDKGYVHFDQCDARCLYP